MKIDDDEFLDGIKAHNFNFIKNYPEKIESEIKYIESKAMKLLTLGGVFITLIITITSTSIPLIIEKIPEWHTNIMHSFCFCLIIQLPIVII